MASESSSPSNTKPPPTLNLPFGHQWAITLPTVYRYENANWIDEFFTHGRLRLSTFTKFSTYPDEIRGDTQEGRGVAIGSTENQTVAIAHAEGSNAFVLCCSTRLDRQLQDAFERDSAFAIENTPAFAHEVARQLRGFRGGLEGQCMYRSDTVIRREFAPDIEDYRLPDGNINMNIMSDTMRNLGGPERQLIKRKKYEEQSEYRLLWHVDAIDGEHIDIECPKAAEHCRRLTDSDYS